MSKHEEASLILKLYELRREETMRKARDWYFRDFQPESMDDIKTVLLGEQGNYLRMITSYWDMAAALVNHGAISVNMFSDANGEHLGVYSKLEPFLVEWRALFGTHSLSNLQKLVDATPGGRDRVTEIRERMKYYRAEVTKRAVQSAMHN